MMTQLTAQVEISEHKHFRQRAAHPAPLTILQVASELRKTVKCYLHAGMKQAHFSLTLHRIEQGTAKPSTIKELFNKLGYQGDFNEWRKAG